MKTIIQLSVLLVIVFIVFNVVESTPLFKGPTFVQHSDGRQQINQSLVQIGFFEGKSYFTQDSPDTWNKSKALCEANNLELATVESEEEFNYLTPILWIFPYWTSAYEDKQTFVWGNGQPFNNEFTPYLSYMLIMNYEYRAAGPENVGLPLCQLKTKN